MKIIYSILMAVALIVPSTGFSSVPGQVNFQGMLEDNNGQPVTGSVNLDFALYDALTNGTQLWAESQSGVSVSSGIYSVALGSVTPLTSAVLDSGSVFLEITVEGEVLSPRQQLLAVPYALKAETAVDAENVGGVSGVFMQQLFLHVDYDGQSIPNFNSLEGLGDIDGDGLANFIDPDNDGDFINDDQEVLNGTGVNLVTPLITEINDLATVAIGTSEAGVPTVITVTGTSFIAGLTAQVGAEMAVVQNVTSTSFEMTVGSGQVAGTVAVTVTNPNAETATTSIDFFDKRVFVTSTLQGGALTQTAAVADAFCAQKASAAGLAGSYIAWYSDPSSNAIDRLTSDGIWARLDGTVVATSLADLTDGSITAPISINDLGVTVVSAVGTNTFNTGLLNPNSCAGSSPTFGDIGRSGTITNWSSGGGTVGCTAFLRYFCFQQ